MRGGEPQTVPEGAGGAGRPNRGGGGSCRRSVAWLPLPPPRSVGVRGGGPGAWPAGGAGDLGGPAAARTRASHARGPTRSTVGLRETVGRGPGRLWERKRTLCPPPFNSLRCHSTSPFTSPSPQTRCPRPSLPERRRRLDIAACLLLHVPCLGSELPSNPALPFGPEGGAGGHTGKGVGGLGEFSVLCCRSAGRLERCCLRAHFCQGSGSPFPSFIPPVNRADIYIPLHLPAPFPPSLPPCLP